MQPYMTRGARGEVLFNGPVARRALSQPSKAAPSQGFEIIILMAFKIYAEQFGRGEQIMEERAAKGSVTQRQVSNDQ